MYPKNEKNIYFGLFQRKNQLIKFNFKHHQKPMLFNCASSKNYLYLRIENHIIVCFDYFKIFLKKRFYTDKYVLYVLISNTFKRRWYHAKRYLNDFSFKEELVAKNYIIALVNFFTSRCWFKFKSDLKHWQNNFCSYVFSFSFSLKFAHLFYFFPRKEVLVARQIC